jgi:hypothetical protein
VPCLKTEQELKKCIEDCERVTQELRRMAQQSNDPIIRTTLLDGSRHAEISARECRFGLEMVSLENTSG